MIIKTYTYIYRLIIIDILLYYYTYNRYTTIPPTYHLSPHIIYIYQINNMMSDNNSDRWLSLVGSLLVSVGLGCKASVGPLFIYILSYYRTTSTSISHQNCQWTLGVYSLPTSILALFSLRLSRMVNIKWYFRSLCLVDSLSYVVSYYQSDFYLFMLFYCWIPNLIAYGLLMVPLLNNIWSNFSTKRG